MNLLELRIGGVGDPGCNAAVPFCWWERFHATFRMLRVKFEQRQRRAEAGMPMRFTIGDLVVPTEVTPDWIAMVRVRNAVEEEALRGVGVDGCVEKGAVRERLSAPAAR